MSRFLTLLLFALPISTFAQNSVEFPFNPDSNNDGIIAVEDLMIMLSFYGGEWQLPAPSDWASQTMLNLLNYSESLDSIADVQSSIQAAIDSSFLELSSISDSLELVTSFNVFATTANRCYIQVSDFNFVSTDTHYDISNDCGCVFVRLQYGQTWSSPFERAKIRLPEQGLFIGQRIFVKMSNDYSDGAPQNIDHYINGQWEYLTTIQKSQGSGSSNFTDSSSNKTFTWTGSDWTVTTGGVNINPIIPGN